MRCLQVHNDYLIAGGETESTCLIGNLLEENNIEVIRYYKKNTEISNLSIFKKILYGINSIFNFKTKKEVEKIIQEQKIDFAIVHNVSPIISNSIYYVLKKNNIPIYKYIQNYNLLCLNGAMNCSEEVCRKCIKNKNFYGLKKRCYKESFFYTLIKLINKHIFDIYFKNSITTYISISDFVKSKHLYYNFTNIKTIYHFVGLINNKIQEKPHNSIKYYLYMGRLSEEKGVKTLLKVFKMLPNEKLIIMGDGELVVEVQNFIKSEASNIEFIGYKTGSEKEEIIRNAYCTIVPSEWEEPFGRIVIESYRHGIPVICTDSGGLKELVSEGITGFKYKSGNIDELHDSLMRFNNLTDNEYKVLKENCYKICKEKFSKEAYYKRFSELID